VKRGMTERKTDWYTLLTIARKMKKEVSKTEYSFCESVPSAMSKWHIRKLTDGGGADTNALCEKKVDWDITVAIDEFHLSNNACKKCEEKYREM